ncbi:MAG: hypothetical protein IKF82_00500 [Bacilli bacterium]|nr:hypothetical protein [Bacilli bacterium]
MKCRFCSNYMEQLDTCKFCNFEFDESFDSYVNDDWDILNLTGEDKDWEHIQILDRLMLKGIQCYKADIWFDNNIAYLLGCRASVNNLAKVLNMHEECIYNDGESDFIILNLFQEKYLRGLLDDEKDG